MSDRTAIIERIIDPEQGNFSPEHARYVLSLSIPKRDQKLYQKLSEKAQLGTLSKSEGETLDHFLNTNAFLTILKSKARISLKNRGMAM